MLRVDLYGLTVRHSARAALTSLASAQAKVISLYYFRLLRSRCTVCMNAARDGSVGARLPAALIVGDQGRGPLASGFAGPRAASTRGPLLRHGRPVSGLPRGARRLRRPDVPSDSDQRTGVLVLPGQVANTNPAASAAVRRVIDDRADRFRPPRAFEDGLEHIRSVRDDACPPGHAGENCPGRAFLGTPGFDDARLPALHVIAAARYSVGVDPRVGDQTIRFPSCPSRRPNHRLVESFRIPNTGIDDLKSGMVPSS